MEENKKLSVWWIPQVPMKSFRVDVPNVESGALILKTLADYDLFQYDNDVKGDYSNAGGLDEWDENENDWVTWFNEDGMDIDEYMEFVDSK